MKKAFSMLLVFVLLLTPVMALGSGDMDIISQPRTTVAQMKAWASGRGAHPEFINQAETFYNISVKYGIDPAVTYAQSAKETNYFNFGGVLDISYNNPCGLKTTEGGGNYDPSAHQRFSSWEQGITAQVHHLALYAGQSGFPDPNSPDPRHFPSIYGVAPTVQDLGGRWAPSPTYGDEVAQLVQSIMATEVADAPVVEESPKPDQRLKRIFGSNRVETAIRASQYLSENKAKRVILSSAGEFADALVGAVYAYEDGNAYPILLNSGTGLNDIVLKEIKRLDPDEVIIVGGPNMISKAAEDRLAREIGVDVTRLEGANRYDTANKVAESLGESDTYILANGTVFADALVISAYSSREEIPILLTNGKNLDKATAQKLKGAREVIIVGGVNAVSSEIEKDLKASVNNVSRLGGSNRFETSVIIAKATNTDNQVFVIASGANFADSLVGSSICGKFGASIILTDGNTLVNSAKALMKSQGATNAIVLGGNNSVNQSVVVELEGILK